MWTDKKLINATIILSSGFYIASLTQSAFCTNECPSALMVLLTGWLGIMMELGALANWVMAFFQGHTKDLSDPIGATFVWLANPLFFFALFTIRDSKKTSLWSAILATLLILSFMLFDKIIGDEGGNYSTITALKTGYWLWLFSSVTLVIGNLIILKSTKNNS